MDQQNSSKIKLVKFDLFNLIHICLTQLKTIFNKIQRPETICYLSYLVESINIKVLSILEKYVLFPNLTFDIETFYRNNFCLTLNLKAPNFSTNSSVKKTVKIMLRASKALSYVGG